MEKKDGGRQDGGRRKPIAGKGTKSSLGPSWRPAERVFKLRHDGQTIENEQKAVQEIGDHPGFDVGLIAMIAAIRTLGKRGRTFRGQ